MKKNNVSIAKISEMTGLPFTTVWRYTQNKFTPSPGNAKIIHDKLGIPIMELLYPDDKAA